MGSFIQLVAPNTGVRDGAGWCLRFTQAVYGAPAMYPSATAAANATRFRHATRTMPNVSVPVWFSHWGTYGSPAYYADWGHVVAWVPGRGFLSSPASGFGQLWLSSIEAVERTFNSRFRFWSEDINTRRVAQPAPKPKPKPTPAPEPELSIGEIMAFKSVGIGYRPDPEKDRLVTTGLDFEDGQKTTEFPVTKSYGESWYRDLTEGGFKILSDKHYAQVLKDFDAAVQQKREHELAVARAGAK